MKLDELLLQLGLTKLEAKAYLSLLSLGSATVQPIAKKSGIKRTSIYNFIEHLIDLGLVSKSSKGNRAVYVAEPPQRLLSLITQRRDLLKQNLGVLDKLFHEHQEIPKFRYFRGQMAVKEAWKEVFEAKEKFARWIVSRESTIAYAGVPFTNQYVLELAKRGIKTKILRRHGEKGSHKFAAPSYAKSLLREIREMPLEAKFYVSMIIFDNTVIVIAPIHENYGFVVESASFAQSLKTFYDQLWEISIPLK